MANLFSDDALRSVSKAVKSGYAEPKEIELCGVPIEYENNSFKPHTWPEWKEVLEKWMPEFDEAGWLDGLRGINIGDSYMNGFGGGEYHHDSMCVAFPQNPNYGGPPYLVSDTKEYALIHEVVHHVHIRNAFDKDACDVSLAELQSRASKFNKRNRFTRYVSVYASKNFLEAVAETCAGIMLGEEYPAKVRRAYLDLDGPVPLRNWSEPPKRLRPSGVNNPGFSSGDFSDLMNDDDSKSQSSGTEVVQFDADSNSWSKNTTTFKSDYDVV